jgi:acetyltransferase-like isoleucine patch superfamily enzyme
LIDAVRRNGQLRESIMWIRDALRPWYDSVSRALYYRLAHIESCEHKKRIEDLIPQMKSCGPRLSIKGPIQLFGVEHVEIGRNVHIGENAFIRAEGGLTIGDNTRISRNLVLYTMNHRYEGLRLPYDDGRDHAAVTIGKNVWIGMNVCITPGTIIGDGVVVGMGTTVSGTVPPLSIIGSQKWRLLGQRDAEHYRQLEEAGAYGDPNGLPL